jgi:UDP-N-acetyl-D-mannosaminuronate dehydrogenase
VETLAQALELRGARVMGFDPFVDHWPEMDRSLLASLPEANSFDAIVITTPHREFLDLDLSGWLGSARPVVLDTANVITRDQRQRCRAAGIRVESVGRGDGL